MSLGQAGDVDIQTVRSVDPAGVDNVVAVPTLALHAGRIHVEEICPFDGRIVGGNVIVVSTVPTVTEILEGGARDLSVNIPVPRKHLSCTVSAIRFSAWPIARRGVLRPSGDASIYLPIPPPSQQGTVGQPGFYMVDVEEGEICAQQV